MKIALNIVAVLLILPGSLFFLQGINVLPGSLMSGQMQWVINGGVMVVIGVILLIVANRRGAPKNGL